MHYFTSITKNYLPKARVLAKSLKKVCPNAIFYLVISDDLPVDFNLSNEPFDEVISIKDLGLPVENLSQWIFMHSVVELCTAVKGQAFVKILTEKNADKVVYLDPDMAVLHNLNELEELLDKYDIILTPHQIDPETERAVIIDNEICSLKHGIYNLGFLAIKNGQEGLRFSKWWRDRLVEFCYDDIPNGLFTDQRWADFTPAYFDKVLVLRDKTYNVATWNLSKRDVDSDINGKLTIDGSPIKIYHFSGFDSGAQEIMLKKYAKNKQLFDLRNWYIDQQDENGQKQLGKEPSIYQVYSNGEPITKDQRVLYRKREDLKKAFPNPDVDYLEWYKNDLMKHKDHSQNIDYSSVDELINSKTWKIVVKIRNIANKFMGIFGITLK